MSLPTSQTAAIANADIATNDLTSLAQIPVTAPTGNQLLVKTEAYAANPTDWKHIALQWSDAGCIVGSDASGTVVAVGPDVTNFAVGDNVSVFVHGAYWETPLVGAFSEYVLADEFLTVKYTKPLHHAVPEANRIAAGPVSSFEGAASITLGITTIALSFGHHLGLSPEVPAPSEKLFLVWGGATATGILAIQVAKLLGWRVIATASKKHHSALQQLGAEAVFDYTQADVVQQIQSYGGENIIRALDTVASEETIQQTHDAVASNEPVVIDNLLFKNASAIKGLKANVTITATLAYVAIGLPVNLRGGMVIPTSDALVADYRKFFGWLVEKVNAGEIHHAPIRVLPGGLKAVNEALHVLKDDKASGEKIVFVNEGSHL